MRHPLEHEEWEDIPFYGVSLCEWCGDPLIPYKTHKLQLVCTYHFLCISCFQLFHNPDLDK